MIRFSVIIPVKPGGHVRALKRLPAAGYPDNCLEIIVAEGCNPSRQRNRAAELAEGDVLYFLDDDSLTSPGFLHRAAAHFADPSVAVAGGPSLTPDSDSPLQHAFGMVFMSRFGGGGVRNRYRCHGGVRITGEHELILCNLSFRRSVFRDFGGFDERLYPNEENELMDRIAASGLHLIHDPDLAVERSQRRTVRAFVRQLYGYGRGRAEQTVISGRFKAVALIPPIFVLYLSCLPFVHTAVLIWPFAVYGLLAVLWAIREGIRAQRFLSATFLPVLFLLFHSAFGIGMICGFLLYPFRKYVCRENIVTVRRVKSFGVQFD